MLCDPYYNMLVGNATLNFTDLVIFGEMIEYAIKKGKINAKGKQEGVVQKNEETQVVFLRSQLSGGPAQDSANLSHHFACNNARSTPYHYQLSWKAYPPIWIVSPGVMLQPN